MGCFQVAKLSGDGDGGSTTVGSSGGSGGEGWSFRQKVLGVITSWIVAGLWQMSIKGVNIVQTVQNIYLSAFGDAGASFLGAFRAAGDSILEVEANIGSTLVELGASTGLAGPIASALVFAFVMVATASLVKGLLNAVKWIT